MKPCLFENSCLVWRSEIQINVYYFLNYCICFWPTVSMSIHLELKVIWIVFDTRSKSGQVEMRFMTGWMCSSFFLQYQTNFICFFFHCISSCFYLFLFVLHSIGFVHLYLFTCSVVFKSVFPHSPLDSLVYGAEDSMPDSITLMMALLFLSSE
jgi:hypothetical protein